MQRFFEGAVQTSFERFFERFFEGFLERSFERFFEGVFEGAVHTSSRPHTSVWTNYAKQSLGGRISDIQ